MPNGWCFLCVRRHQKDSSSGYVRHVSQVFGVDDIQGLVAQGRTATEALEIARKLIEARSQRTGDLNLAMISDSFDYPLIVNA